MFLEVIAHLLAGYLFLTSQLSVDSLDAPSVGMKLVYWQMGQFVPVSFADGGSGKEFRDAM